MSNFSYSNKYNLEWRKYMREILLDELKDRQIAILDVVDAFCRENNIGLIQERYLGL